MIVEGSFISVIIVSSQDLLGCGRKWFWRALRMEAARFSRMLVFYNTTWHSNPKGLNLNLHSCTNFKPHVSIVY
jgi:hypothetical protein